MRFATLVADRRVRNLLLIAITNLIGLSSLAAQSNDTGEERKPDYPGLDIQAVVGWDGRVEVDAPVPISFLISNQSGEVLEGQFILTDSETDREINLGDVFVGPGSTRRFSAVLDLSDWNGCVAEYTDGSQVFWTRELPLMTGKDFSEEVNYLLFVEDGGRALQLPIAKDSGEVPSATSGSPQAATADSAPGRYSPRLGYGQDVQPVSVKFWQVPQHPGPLTVAQAMLFSDSAKFDMLNDGQWDAIGRWICQGGTIFIHESAKEVFERLRKAAPLRTQPAVLLDEHQVHRCGAGSIREYSGALFSADDTGTITRLLGAISRLSRYSILSVPDDLPRNYVGSSNANFTRMMVLAVFSIYTLFSGVVALLLFRSTRRTVVSYTVSVVLIACLAAGVLGTVLRNSRGDLHWQSVILGSPGGAIQAATIEVQSAGGRTTRLAVQGKNADLQLLRNRSWDNYSRYAIYGNRENQGVPGYKAFTVQPNLLKDQVDAFQIHVPLTPWGVRQNIAAAYDPDSKGVHLDLKFRSDGPASGATTTSPGDSWTYVVPGQWTISATNNLPFDLRECRLLLTTSVPQVSANYNSRAYASATTDIQFDTGRGQVNIDDLSAAATKSALGSNTAFVVRGDNVWYRNRDMIEPEPAFPGASELWFIARVFNSPLLTVNDEFSDFEHLDGVHYYMQRVPQEEIPQEWRDVCQQALEQQLNVAQEQLKVLKTQQPQIPQF
ncbi:MAG: hypothetical protein U0936_20980 [Planctomycetaceae bacterium]